MPAHTSADTLHPKPDGAVADGRDAVRLLSALVRLMLRNPILPILIVALPSFALFVPFYATLGNLANLLLASSILLLLASGGALVMITGNIDLSVEGTLAFTSMVAAWLMVPLESGGSGLLLAPWLAILVSLAIGLGIGALNALLVEGLNVNPFIVTIGMLLALKGAAAIPTQATTVYGLPDLYSWVGLNDAFGVSWVVIISFILCFIISLWLRNSVAGRHLYALGGSKAAAYENGVLPRRTTMLAYCMSGGLAAIAGWLNAARLNSASASAGDGITFTVFAAMIIGGISLSGGRGGLWGVLGGVTLLTSIDNVLNLIALNPLYVNFVRGIVILLAVVLIVIRQKLAERLRIQEPAGVTDLIALAGISKHFGGVAALDNVSMTISPGEAVALMGGNGAGKSTLVSILSGLQRPDGGSITVDGTEQRFDEPKHARALGIETVFQNLALCGNLDASGNLFLGREIHWGVRPFRLLRRRAMLVETRQTLERLGVRIPDLHATASSYSGGQRQALAFARAARAKSRLLILDEPTAALGVEESANVVATVRRLRQERGVAVLLITHNLEEMRKMAERAIVLRRGRLVATLPLSQADDDRIVSMITGSLGSGNPA